MGATCPKGYTQWVNTRFCKCNSSGKMFDMSDPLRSKSTCSSYDDSFWFWAQVGDDEFRH